MSRDETVNNFLWGALIGSIVASTIWSFVIVAYTRPESDAIKHGAAYYHPETGEFTWKQPEKENP